MIFLNTYFVSSHMYPENPEETQVIVGSMNIINPLTTVAISKLQEMIDGSTYILVCSIATALDSDINQTTGLDAHLSM